MLTVSMRKPSTPRSSQNLIALSKRADLTSGFSQLKSGCSGTK